ncbi:developmental pluripotency-associated protein 4 isoform X2 [Lepus europaeus]|uniref:developmental pluripotency-associated protein 4 isoform X2 n=1 Tax=Lepus europaeus TaxID=9983 RepID=UPI002B469F35|nr:developmental pluripotency-associated protein 4 isoform X2 [Lepus europaeus]
MENSRGKERTATGWSREEEQWALSQPSTSLPRTSEKEGNKRKRSMKDDKVSCPKERGQCDGNPKPRKKVPIPPLPVDLPPIDLVHRDILRAWGQKLRLSTKGPKIDLYKRLCEYAYPHQKMVCGPWEKSPCKYTWLGSAAVSCRTSLGS